MRRFVFERRFQIESTTCERCGGTGHPSMSRDPSVGIATCFWCKGLGWKPTDAGRDVFYDVLALLNISVTRWPKRIDPWLVRGKKFTEKQLQDVDAFMASHVGRGAVETHG